MSVSSPYKICKLSIPSTSSPALLYKDGSPLAPACIENVCAGSTDVADAGAAQGTTVDFMTVMVSDITVAP